MTSNFNAEHPQPSHLFYVQAPATDKAFWMSMDTELDEWTGFFLLRPIRQIAVDLFGPSMQMFWRGPTPSLGLKAPVIELLSDTVAGNIRNVSVTVQSARQAPAISVQIEGADVYKSTVQNHAYSTEPMSDWSVNIYAMQDAAVRLDLQMHSDSAFKMRVTDISYGLPPAVIQQRPSYMMGQPLGFGDTQQTISVLNFPKTPLPISSLLAPTR